MKKILLRVVLASLAMSMTACGGEKQKSIRKEKKENAIAVDKHLTHVLDSFATAPRCSGKFGLYVYDLTAEKPVYAMNEKEGIPSASCMKLLSGVAGLKLLGTKYMYQTSIYTRGKMDSDTLRGDVSFKADLDPQLQDEDMRQFAQALRRKGIKKIDGKLIIDLFLKEPVKSEEHWYPWDLSFSKYGVIYKGPERVKRALKGAIRAAGIQLKDDQIVMAQVPKDSHCIYRYYSGINKVISRMWKNSSNTKATTMLYTIGKKVNPKGNPTEAGVKYLQNFLHKEIGMTDSTLVVHDGCGLCTHNHLSAEALVRILDYGYHDKEIFDYLWRYLAISGVDGTLARFGYELRGKVHAKTGTLSHPYGISSLAGYCKAQNGHLLAFAIMDSEMSVLDAHVLQRKLCKILVK